MQDELFDDDADAAASIPGLRYQRDFLGADEEASLLQLMRALPFHAARYKGYLARRRVVSFGGSFDYDTNTLRPAAALDDRLLPLRDRVADWLGVPSRSLAHVLVSEYAPGTPLGWHRDVPEFETIAGVSLGHEAVLRFRPYPPEAATKDRVLELNVAPRSIYRISGAARWGWQHAVPPVKAMRWSITFRRPRQGVSAARAALRPD